VATIKACILWSLAATGLVAALIVGALLCRATRHDNMWHLQQRIGDTSYAAVALACQQVLALTTNAAYEELLIKEANTAVTMYPSYHRYHEVIPALLQQYDPQEIILTRDTVVVRLRFPGRRIALLAFAHDCPEFGTVKLADGLWYWSGSGSESERLAHFQIGSVLGHP